MKLHPNIVPQESEFYWADKSGKRRPVKQRGIWLGSPGNTFRHVFVPLHLDEKPPDPEAWGIAASRSGRPKIASNYDANPGLIRVVSSYQGDGPIVGHVLVSSESLENMEVIASGLGGAVTAGTRFSEYLLLITGTVDLLVIATVAPNLRLVIQADGQETLEKGVDYTNLNDTQYLSLEDPRVRRRLKESYVRN